MSVGLPVRGVLSWALLFFVWVGLAPAQEVAFDGGLDEITGQVAFSQFSAVASGRLYEYETTNALSKYVRVVLDVSHLPPATDIVVWGDGLASQGAVPNEFDYRFANGSADKTLVTGLIFGERANVLVTTDRPDDVGLSVRFLQQVDPDNAWQSIVDEDDERYIGEVARPDLERIGRSVVYLSVIGAGLKLENCSGFVVGDDEVMTNNHCIANADECSSATIIFDYFYDSFGSLSSGQQMGCKQVLATDYALDFTVFKTTAQVSPEIARLHLSSIDPTPLEPAVLIHHPRGDAKKVSILGCTPVENGVEGRGDPPLNDDLAHRCDTVGGSSGSPMLVSTTADPNGFCVVALHHWGFVSAGKFKNLNRAVMAPAIIAKLGSDGLTIGLCQ